MGAGEAKRYSARAPSWLTDQGTPVRSRVAATPAVNASHKETMRANAEGVSTDERVARIAATDRALPARVPPTPPTSTRSADGSDDAAAATLGRDAVGPAGDPAADALADHEDVGGQVPQGGGAARPGREGVRLVDHQQGAVLRGQGAQAREETVRGKHDPDVGQRRLGEDRRDVAVRELLLDGGQVVELADPGGLRRGRRAARRGRVVRPPRPSGPGTAKASSTEPW